MSSSLTIRSSKAERVNAIFVAILPRRKGARVGGFSVVEM